MGNQTPTPVLLLRAPAVGHNLPQQRSYGDLRGVVHWLLQLRKKTGELPSTHMQPHALTGRCLGFRVLAALRIALLAVLSDQPSCEKAPRQICHCSFLVCVWGGGGGGGGLRGTKKICGLLLKSVYTFFMHSFPSTGQSGAVAVQY